MVFKNMVAFRLPNGWNLHNGKLETALAKLRERHCGPIEKSAFGWEPPVGNGTMVHTVNGHKLIRMRVEEKMLPGSVIAKELKKRCKKIEMEQGREPGRKEMKEMKEQIETELLPKAFVKEKFIPVWIDKKGQWIGIDVGSASKASEVIDALRNCVDDLPEIQSIITSESPSYVMRTWLANEKASHGFSIDDECELISTGEVKASVKYTRHPLDGDDVHQHLNEGKLPKSLGVTHEDTIAFVFNDALEIKKIELIGFEDEDGNSEHQEENFDAGFIAQVEAMADALLSLVMACGGESDEGDSVQGVED